MHVLFLSVAGGESLIPVGWCKGVKNPYVQKGTLSVLAPEAVCFNIEPGSILQISGSVIDPCSIKWLKLRFNAHGVAHFSQKMCSQVPQLVVPN